MYNKKGDSVKESPCIFPVSERLPDFQLSFSLLDCLSCSDSPEGCYIVPES